MRRPLKRFTDGAMHESYLLPLQDAGPGHDLIGHLRLSRSSRYARLVGKKREVQESSSEAAAQILIRAQRQ